ncbi:MAG: AMP-binding protein [Mesorhizobium sp.]|nr:AMP-binding protein [Mesorhizobium sp.]
MIDPYSRKPWLARYPKGSPHEIDVAALGTIADLLATTAEAHRDAVAYSCNGERLTYGELLLKAHAVTRWLQDQGLVKGDRIALMMPNVMAFPVALFGVLSGGFIATCVNPQYTPRELANQLRDSDASALIVLDELGGVVREALQSVPIERVVVAGDGPLDAATPEHLDTWNLGTVSLSQVLELGGGRAIDPVSIAPSDTAFLQYTGGTTGVSKGAVLSHANINGNAEMMRLWFEPPLRERVKDGSIIMIAALPLYHIYALNCCCVLSVRMAAHCVLVRDPRRMDAFVDLLASTPFHIIWGVNTLYISLLNHPRLPTIDFSNVVFSVGGGAAMQAPIAEAWTRLTGIHVLEGYGMSETSPCVTLNRPDEAGFNGAVGYPLPSIEISLRDDDGLPVPFGQAGEVCIRAPTVMKEYWRKPKETAAAFTADGYLKSGDVAIMEPDGLMRIVDRKKDIIIVSGFNVYPNEVENVLAGHPAILEVAVVGVPDERTGERVVAYVVPRSGEIDIEELRGFARTMLTAYKVPKEFVAIDELPKTAVGKVLRRNLRDNADARKSDKKALA